MKTRYFLIAAAGLFATSCNSNRDSKTMADSVNTSKDSLHSKKVYNDYVVSGPDAKFAVEAYNGNMAEVELGALAQQKTTNADVKEFAAMMITDHSKAKATLKSIADAHKVTLPLNVNIEVQDLKKDLATKQGADFDKAYVDAMVKDHEEDVAAFKQAQNILTYDDLLKFNKETLPVLETSPGNDQKDQRKIEIVCIEWARKQTCI